MADFHHWWLDQPSRMGYGSESNTATILAIAESCTAESSSHKKRRLLDIIIGAPAGASAVLEPVSVRVRGRPSGSAQRNQPSAFLKQEFCRNLSRRSSLGFKERKVP